MIRVGSCSWTEKTLIKSGEFYPPGVSSPAARLRFYADHFKTVEVNSSYYAIPGVQTAQQWVERTPGDFTFHVKVYGALTGHGVDPKTLPGDIQNCLSAAERSRRYIYLNSAELLEMVALRFREMLEPLKKSGKLGILIFQYPPWFHCKDKSLAFIEKCQQLMPGLELGIEFRHGSWLTSETAPEVFSFLKQRKLTYITADEPQYGSLATIPFLPQTTTRTAYFRLHGRNRQNWLKKGIETSLRYSYLYSEAELQEFLPVFRQASHEAEATYVMLNNCHGGFAIKNALRLARLLSQAAG